MASRQIVKLAKELGFKSSKELMEILKGLGIEKPSNFSVLEEDEYEKFRKYYERRGQAEPAPPQATAPLVREAPPKREDAAPAAVSVIAPPKAAPQEETVQAPAKPKVKPTGQPRPPVVAVLGHVDHGKTTLLDQIRKTHVAQGEAGGITQSIGAYQVEYQGKKITFIDTPGHRAFTGMRARGAQATDMAILVVAADDGVMEQTREAIAHARAAGVPILVAINKIDKPGVDLKRVKAQLAEEGLTPEDWGGETITVPVSALTGQGLDELLEMILLVAELEELRADPKRPAQGIIIESHLDPTRGPVATAILRDGTLRERDVVVAGTAWGRVRALLNDRGQRITEASAGLPVLILGLSHVPPLGIPLEVVDSPAQAKKIVEERQEQERRARLQRAHLTWEDVLARAAAQKGVLRLILKADTLGSLEAATNELQQLQTDDLKIEILFAGVGTINESDVLLAASSEDEVSVLGFRVELDPKAKEVAEGEQVTVRTYDIIYQLTEDVRKALKGLVEPEFKELKIGEAEVRGVFKIPKVGTVAGCYVRDGVVLRHAQVRVMRNGSPIFQGKLQSLKRFDQDVREVPKDKECGIKIEGFEDVKVGDRLEIFTLRRVDTL